MGSNSNLKPWPKGTSGNPGGRPRRELTPESVGNVIEKYMLLPQGELQAIYDDQTTPGINALAAGACLEAIRSKKWDLAEKMLDRAIGKVTDVSEVHSHDATLEKQAKILSLPREVLYEFARDEKK